MANSSTRYILVIGDIAFPNASLREEARQRWRDVWADSEFYWSADEALDHLKRLGITAEYTQVSSCAGIFVVRR